MQSEQTYLQQTQFKAH